MFFYLFHFICLLFVQSELHGLAALQWSICLDSLSRYIFFWELTSPLFLYIEFETSRLSSDECKTFVLAPVYDKGDLGFQYINSFLSYLGAMVNPLGQLPTCRFKCYWKHNGLIQFECLYTFCLVQHLASFYLGLQMNWAAHKLLMPDEKSMGITRYSYS